VTLKEHWYYAVAVPVKIMNGAELIVPEDTDLILEARDAVTINRGGKLTVKADARLIFLEDLNTVVNEDKGTLIIEAGGTLVVDATFVTDTFDVDTGTLIVGDEGTLEPVFETAANLTITKDGLAFDGDVVLSADFTATKKLDLGANTLTIDGVTLTAVVSNLNDDATYVLNDADSVIRLVGGGALTTVLDSSSLDVVATFDDENTDGIADNDDVLYVGN